VVKVRLHSAGAASLLHPNAGAALGTPDLAALLLPHQAEKWFIIAAALQDGNGILRGARDQLEKTMSPAEVSEAKRQAQEWLDVCKTRKR
jgi:hypothetical protein